MGGLIRTPCPGAARPEKARDCQPCCSNLSCLVRITLRYRLPSDQQQFHSRSSMRDMRRKCLYGAEDLTSHKARGSRGKSLRGNGACQRVQLAAASPQLLRTCGRSLESRIVLRVGRGVACRSSCRCPPQNITNNRNKTLASAPNGRAIHEPFVELEQRPCDGIRAFCVPNSVTIAHAERRNGPARAELQI